MVLSFLFFKYGRSFTNDPWANSKVASRFFVFTYVASLCYSWKNCKTHTSFSWQESLSSDSWKEASSGVTYIVCIPLTLQHSFSICVKGIYLYLYVIIIHLLLLLQAFLS